MNSEQWKCLELPALNEAVDPLTSRLQKNNPLEKLCFDNDSILKE